MTALTLHHPQNLPTLFPRAHHVGDTSENDGPEGRSLQRRDEANRPGRWMSVVLQKRYDHADNEQVICIGEKAMPEMNMIFQCCS
jgi:hypothetical protein